MGKVHQCLSESLIQWIWEQNLFFVATAASRGHVNISPKGHMHGCFAVLSPTSVAYLDFSGSGAETAAHLNENGRITLFFVAFSGPPQILRLYGHAVAVPRNDVPQELRERFSEEYISHNGFRAIITVNIHRISTSCGFSIPLYDYVGERDVLLKLFAKKTLAESDEYRILKNSFSIDKLPSIGNRALNTSAPIVAARLKDGYWWGYTDLTPAEHLQSWVGSFFVLPALGSRDVAMLSFGAVGAAILLKCARS
ncbi:unnamed protein product [Polarella glacialis]|uniref:Pyridoxamine 5'-phosphate oxidase N-terminal domain-containing protein n=1 Tax=Polarella glacialis TaxID=89957 RepID=A0A813KFF6_POLGL|nr:unnamed protein product [Polarella glacialis]CAE8699088.1 unnamed protein product [Polarella glacialis]